MHLSPTQKAKKEKQSPSCARVYKNSLPALSHKQTIKQSTTQQSQHTLQTPTWQMPFHVSTFRKNKHFAITHHAMLLLHPFPRFRFRFKKQKDRDYPCYSPPPPTHTHSSNPNPNPPFPLKVSLQIVRVRRGPWLRVYLVTAKQTYLYA